MGSLVPRPSPPSGFDFLQFAKTASTQKLEVVKDGKEARPEYECDIVHLVPGSVVQGAKAH